MHPLPRLLLALAALAVVSTSARTKTPPPPAEYRPGDQGFYLRADVVRAEPTAPIFAQSAASPAPASDQPGSIFLPAKRHPAPVVYVQTSADWVEPITPPDKPKGLDVPRDAMQVREPQGDVQAALPSAPASFNAVTDGQVLPNGSVLKTGADGTAAVLFGGVASVRLAPHAQAAVQMMIQPGRREIEIDLHEGMAFSKVGQLTGEKESYTVHTSFGDAVAHGTDFVTVVLPQRVDVWLASGTVKLSPATGGTGQAQTLVSTGKEPLRIMRLPLAKDAATTRDQDSETLTSMLQFIPLANQKVKRLRDRAKGGATLSPAETAYLARLRQVGALQKFSYVAPPPPPVPVVVTPPPPTPAPVVAPPPPAPAPAPEPPKPAAPAPAASTAADPNSLVPGANPKNAAPKVDLDLRDQETTPPGKSGDANKTSDGTVP